MNDNIAVKIDHVSKFFRLPTEATSSLRTTLVNRLRGIKGYKEQHVLKDIDFVVEKGDFFGIVGRNGSGKSTLLKIISQIYTPEKGQVTVNGKLVSFIELGVGFNPELTGKENVYLNGAMLGFSREEISAMYDEIVDFAELHEFMNQKLKNYSSGMQVRLAFSVAIKARGDVLVLDEVLAVGDEAFQKKCNDYFLERQKSGQTTILVTHDMGAVNKYCNKAVYIKDGIIEESGSPEKVAMRYSLDNMSRIAELTKAQEAKAAKEEQAAKDETVESHQYVDNLELKLLSDNIVKEGETVKFEVSYRVLENMRTHVVFSLMELDHNFWLYNDNSTENMTDGKGTFRYVYEFKLENINKQKVKIQVSVFSEDDLVAYVSEVDSPRLIVGVRTDDEKLSRREQHASTGVIKRNGDWRLESIS
ncbi:MULTISPECIES: ABC transporter ATP-binding protein [unclassified Lactococcus]|uniref:ABC transporter ATP-binding protein n=1 Tax=unclassified Lactococcus TaxID=2643510 RepID=UPI0011CC0799|nr:MULTISPECIES: ABC transporter ATP-binding protein [unclassified Lactococcus]MQW22813.1 ATP-binding cassette domain-containing protein [Lactococcus sp. dk101]TXK44816.1 ABC transporter ATP-binding protein [Lactococcus sp. dk310]TXK50710.1 ABC transporter ATP-binding protein [Lactococcus sp. dk322]